MADTKLSLVKWFLTLYFVSIYKDGIFEIALVKYINVTLETVGELLHKIRSAMGEHDSTYRFSGSIEMDEAYSGRKSVGKHGQGNENKTEVAVALQLDGNGYP